ncbi:DUF2142 domain-containing protein [Acetobacterium paludosum]|nr:DUF2142 domain-containing protein [Acetobacterium paludosum]
MKKKLVVTGIIIIILSLIIEIFIFNLNFFIRGNESERISKITSDNLMVLENGNYKILENGASIRFDDINNFINKLEFKTNSFNKNVNIQIAYNGIIKADNINNIDKKSICINDWVDSIQITFLDGKGQEIYMDEFFEANYFQFNPFRFLMILLFFILSGVVGYTVFNKEKIKLEVVFLILILCFGLLNSIMTPIFYSWDEAEHFIRAYNLANNNLVMQDGDKIAYPSHLKEFFDKKLQIENPNYRTFEEYSVVTQKNLSVNYADTEMAYYPSTAISYTFIPYLFSSLGIVISKIMNFPFLISFYFGRAFNLLMYAALVYFAIKIIPCGKKLLFLCALLPTIVFQAASYSADVVINGLCFFVFALIIKLSVEKKTLGIIDLVMMCSCFVLITASKLAYVPIFLLVMILKHDNFTTRKKEWIIKISIFLLGCLTFVGAFIYGQKFGLSQWNIPGVNAKEQIISIIYNPINYAAVILRTIMTQKEYLLGGASVSLAYIGYLGRDALLIVFFMLFLISGIDTDNSTSIIKIRDRGIIFMVCLLTVGLSMTALYITFTPVKNTTVLGFQGRYLIPLIFPFLFLFQRKANSTSVKSEIVNTIVILFSVCILFISIVYVFNLYYV